VHEQSLRQLFKRMAEVEPPPTRVTVAGVLRQCRVRRRWRRISRAGTPVLAAVAVAAIALTAALPTGGSAKHSPQAGGYGRFVDGAFNPSYLTLKFGWLPTGATAGGGSTGPADEEISAYSSRRGQWFLDAYARDVCQLAGGQFRCSQPDTLPLNVPVSSRGPLIAGRGSFWLQGGGHGLESAPTLAWEYAKGAWALLQHMRGRNQSDASAIVARIAKGAEFGQRIPLSFTSRFTSLPSSGWRILAASFSTGPDAIGSPPAGVYLAWSYKVLRLRTISPATPVVMGDDVVPGVPLVGIFPALSGSNGCQDTRSKHVTIHGYEFIVSDLKSSAHRDDYSVRCPDVDGLTIWVNEIGAAAHPSWALSPAQVLERTQLLGPDPADWTTDPLP
jgi:hypothetical protein